MTEDASSEPVERAVDAALPERTVERIEPQTVRPGNETAYVTFADAEPVYVKTETDEAGRLRREVAAIRHAAEHCGVETPPIVAADVEADPPHLVTAPLPGTPLNEPWTDGADREPLLRRLGAAIAGVHEAEFDRPGEITGVDAGGTDPDGRDDVDLALAGDAWTDVLCRTVEWRASNWFAERFDDLPERLVETIREFDPTLQGTPTLLHGDPSRINVHLDPAGLLDWERALVGDPAFGLAEAAFHHLGQPDVEEDERPRLRAALHEGYRERAGALPDGLERNRPLYRAVAYLLVPQTFEDWAPEAPDPEDEIAAEVREEFEARLERARREAG